MRDHNHKEMIPLSILTRLGLTLMTRRNVTVLHLDPDRSGNSSGHVDQL